MERPGITVWALRVDDLDEAAVRSWRACLDAAEIARADRFVYAHSRIEFTAAHALTRRVLGDLLGEEGRAFHFLPGPQGKPEARLRGAAAPLSFNLSHTRGLVAVAVSPIAGLPLGVDVERLDREVDLRVADNYFDPREVAWLAGLPEPARPEGFLRLWTLKEAFIKATGKGLTQDLGSFGFEVAAARVRFTDAVPDDPSAWLFRQRIVADRFVAAVGWRRPDREAGEPVWRLIGPEHLSGL